MLPLNVMWTSLTTLSLCCVFTSSQSLSQFFMNMVSQPNLDPFTKNFMRTSVAQEMFDIEVPPPAPTTPPPEGQFGRPGEANMFVAPSTGETMPGGSSPPSSKSWNNALPTQQVQGQGDVRQRQLDSTASWTERSQQPGNSYEQQNYNNPRETFESPQSRYGNSMASSSQSTPSSWSTLANLDSLPVRQSFSIFPQMNGFFSPPSPMVPRFFDTQMEGIYPFQGNAPRNDYFPPGNYQYQGGVPSRVQNNGNTPANYQSPGNAPTNYQNPGNAPSNYQNPGNIPTNYQNPGNLPPNFPRQASVAPSYQMQNNVPENQFRNNGPSFPQNQENAPGNLPQRNFENYQNFENSPPNFPRRGNINERSQELPETTPSPPANPSPNSMPENSHIFINPPRTESGAPPRRNQMDVNMQDRPSEPRENSPSYPNPQWSGQRKENIPGSVSFNPMASFPNANENFQPFNSQQGPFMGPNQVPNSVGLPLQVPLGRNLFVSDYNMSPFTTLTSSTRFPSDLLYLPPASSLSQLQSSFPFVLGQTPRSQATPAPPMASFAAMRRPTPQDLVKAGQVILPRSVPSPYMMDKMMSLMGIEGVELI